MPQLHPHQVAQVRRTLAAAAQVSRLYEAHAQATAAAADAATLTTDEKAPEATRLKEIQLFSPDGRQMVRHQGPGNDQVDAVEALLVRLARELDAKFEALGGQRPETCPMKVQSIVDDGELCPYAFPANPGGTRVEGETRVGPIVYRAMGNVTGVLGVDGATWYAGVRFTSYAKRDGQTASWKVRVIFK